MFFCKLSEIKEGIYATIRSIEKEEFSLKLLEIGIIPGEKLYMESNKNSSLPIIINIHGCSISLRKEEASYVVVEYNI